VNEERERTFVRLLSAHGAAIRRLTAGYERDPGLRQDLEQEIHLAIWKALATFSGQCAERTFVFRVAHNQAISHIRRWSLRRVEPLDEGRPVADARANPEQILRESERREALAAAVRQLPLGLRQVVLLLLEGCSHKEASDVLGISEGNVAVRATRARRALAATLGASQELR
jgi:RNA polymerase sigma-70 factor, ECF subfamily